MGVVARPKRGTIVEATPPCTSPAPRWIAGHPVELLDVDLGPRRVALYAVRDLEELVDRAALLRGEAEPPYWAYLWSGARVLASYLARFVDCTGLRVLEIGCGLGLPGITAAVLGGETTLVDAAANALELAAASARANGVRCDTLEADFTALDPAEGFDVVLAAEVAYDRERWPELAAVCERHLRPGGGTLLADGYRTDTRGLYAALAALDLQVHAIDVRVVEEGHALPVRLAAIRRRTPVSSRGTPRRPA
jgi:predicted nicotinamide N-methyase